MNIKLKFIEAIMSTLKIEQNPFTISAIDKTISFLNETDYSDFILELHNGKNNFKTAIEKISITADIFKSKFNQEISKDSETKAIELITKVKEVFTAVDYVISKNKQKSNNRTTSHSIFSKMPFHKVRKKDTKENVFSAKEIKALLEIGDIKQWYSIHCNYDGLSDDNIVTKLTLAIRRLRIEFYMQDNNKIKLLGVK